MWKCNYEWRDLLWTLSGLCYGLSKLTRISFNKLRNTRDGIMVWVSYKSVYSLLPKYQRNIIVFLRECWGGVKCAMNKADNRLRNYVNCYVLLSGGGSL
jgi:hypothetical protein